MNNKDQSILEVVYALSRDLMRDKSFRDLLTKLDKDGYHRVARSYVEWLIKTVQQEKQEPPQ